ncbi:MAG: hypothetical protein LIO75_07415 [Lachnospiraceae bacterium]|nr:hypothetical protein [Lachnospiraceae bacterium]MCC8174261.1 hypothetical protein [Odoribacter sp.]
MGGRGTFAAGNPVPYTYKKVGDVEGVKVLEGINGKHGLPESSHSSEAYIKLKPDGTFHEMRFYDKDHVLYMEIAYHPEYSLTGDRHTPVLHYHLYDSSFSKNKTGAFSRSKAARLTEEMKLKYKKYFKGVSV